MVIARETNLYYRQYMATTPQDQIRRQSRVRDWIDTDADELKLFFAITITMGILQKPKIESYWSLDEVLFTPFYGTLMSRNRYQLLLRFLHLNDNSQAAPRGDVNYDPLYKIHPLCNAFRTRAREVYTPGRDLGLDEGTMLWKGHISYRIYNRHVRGSGKKILK